MKKARMLLLLFAVGMTSAFMAAPLGAAEVPQDPLLTAAAPKLSCPCPCSPLAGAWVGRLASEDEKIIQTFKFVPVNETCDRFVVNSEPTTRPAKVIKVWPEVTDLTGFVGTACKLDCDCAQIDFTAIGYGVRRTSFRERVVIGPADSADTMPDRVIRTDYRDEVVFIAVMSGTIELPEECESCQSGDHSSCDKNCGQCECCKDGCKDPKCGCNTGDHSDCKDDGKCLCCKDGCENPECECQNGDNSGDCKCLEPEKLNAEVTVAYYDAEQDKDRDGFPDTCDAAICIPYELKLKPVVLKAQCKPSQTCVAFLTACAGCETDAVGRAIFKRSESDDKISFVVTVKDIDDVKAVKVLVSDNAGDEGKEAIVLCPEGSDKLPTGRFSGLLCCGTFATKDCTGPLKDKPVSDFIKACKEGRASVVVTTKKHPKGEICGTTEDP